MRSFYPAPVKVLSRSPETKIMMNLANIEKTLDEGSLSEAENAIDDLLALGPNNIGALKLKAQIFEHQGLFRKADQIWQTVGSIDAEDEEAYNYFQKLQLEIREHYYFTDVLPDGGKRYLAYPKSLVQISLVGLVGCISFLFLSEAAPSYTWLNRVDVLLGSFALLVILPWIAIIYTYFTSLQAVEITGKGLKIGSRTKAVDLAWNEIQAISLAYSSDFSSGSLDLIIEHSLKDLQTISINFDCDTCAVRARRQLLDDLEKHGQKVTRQPYEALNLDEKNLIKY